MFSMFPLNFFLSAFPRKTFEIIFLFPESYSPKLPGAIFPFISIWSNAEAYLQWAKNGERRVLQLLFLAERKDEELGTAKRKSFMEKKMLIT